MALGDGANWDESNPQQTTLANQIDSYERDIRKGVRGRMGLEHVWPASQTGTAEAGYHTIITFQAQTGTPVMPVVASVTQAGMLYVQTGALIYQNSAGATTILIASGNIHNIGSASYSATGTFGDILYGTGTGQITPLAASADGLGLLTHSNTGAPTWGKVIVYSGTGTVNTPIVMATNFSLGGNTMTNGKLGVVSTGSVSILSDSAAHVCPAGCYIIGGFKQNDGNFTQLIYASF